MKPAYQLARGKREEGGREKGSRSAWNLTISGWFALFLCNYRDRARPLFSLSSLFGSTFFGLSSLSTKLLPQINFATSASLQTPRSAVERSIFSWNTRARIPFRIRRIVQLENRKGTFIDSITFIYTYIFSREMIPSGSLSSSPSSVFPSRAAALTSDFLEWEALRLHRVIRFHEGTLKFKSSADRLFLSPFFPNRGWKWIYSRGNAALRRIGKSRKEEREDGRE